MTHRVLFVSSEVYPLVKTGGLADVSYALPRALVQMGHDVRVLIPGYREVLAQLACEVFATDIWILPGVPYARVLAGQLPNSEVPVFVLDLPALYQRDGGPYQAADGSDWHDNPIRFGALGKLAALFVHEQSVMDWRPDIVHLNDWQPGLAAAHIALNPSMRAHTVTTVHNVAFPGSYSPELLNALDIPGFAYQVEGLEFYGQLSFLKAGLHYADRLTTVSPTYAEELKTDAFGGGFQGLFAARSDRLRGILNGIDTDVWDPATDPLLNHHYDRRHLGGKTRNKSLLQRQLGLPVDPHVPVLGLISRLTYQKGIDLLCQAIRELNDRTFQLALLGSGDPTLEHELWTVCDQLGARAHLTIGYDESLSHLIEAGADFFLMPSRFEPCGLNQMYSMRYGTPPIVRRTGGLADSVVHADRFAIRNGDATGFVFDTPSATALANCIRQALDVFAQPEQYQSVQYIGMSCDFSWNRQALAYESLYDELNQPNA
ncbi:MAG: glycogen synthase GlgA [Pseudomonadota bacterium]